MTRERLNAADEHEARTSSLERFADRKTAGGFGNLTADQTALYCDIISAMAHTRELEAQVDALREKRERLTRAVNILLNLDCPDPQWRQKKEAARAEVDGLREPQEPEPATVEPMVELLSPLAPSWPLAREVPIDAAALREPQEDAR